MRAIGLSVIGCVFALFCAGTAPGVAAEQDAPPKADSLFADDGLLESFSLSSDRGPVRIEAATLEFEYRTGLLTYRGGVEVSQANITLNSDELRLQLDTEDLGRPKEIVARGHVRIVSGDRIATGGRAVFNQSDQTIVLSEDAVLRDGPNEVAGDKIVVFLDQQRSVVEGGEKRVRAVLFPSGDKAESDPTTLSRVPDDER